MYFSGGYKHRHAWTTLKWHGPPQKRMCFHLYIGHPKGYNKKMRGWGEHAEFLGGSFGSLVSFASFCLEFSLKYWDFHDPI